MLYFAYGSNLDWEKMKKTVPSSIFYGKVKLENYRLDFTRESINWGCGVADIVKDENKCVWGVIYQFNKKDLKKLDESEGYIPNREKGQNAYVRIEKKVYLEGEKDQPITVHTYEVFDKKFDKHKPNKEYKYLIVSGAKHWKLPEDYISFLENIETMKNE
jgi:gamma-glutamylcyclotransferase (GGCT)/AIG2-like uncharacterized protein YtfP